MTSKSECSNANGRAHGKAVLIRRAQYADVPALMDLSRDSAKEAGVFDKYDAVHNRAHLTELLTRGVGFVACKDELVIGAAIFTPIDTGYSLLEHLESAHLYVHTGHRSMPIVRALIRAVEQFSNDHGVVMLLHQISYPAAIDGRLIETSRVGALYRHFRLEGSFSATHVIRPDGGEDN